MRDIDLYAQILNIQAPWTVEDVELDQSGGEVRVHVARDEAAPLECPECHQAVPGYDTRHRQWRHLDTCQLRTLLVADVPRVSCPEHGVRQIDVPWAEEGFRLTALFETLVIDWLQEASIQAVSQRLGLSWDAVDGIMQRRVKRGLARRDPVASTALAVDEKAYKKHHNYLTVVSDGIRALHVAEGRREDSLGAFFETLTPEQRPHPLGQHGHVDALHPGCHPASASRGPKIAFDRFHVAKQFNEAVDLVRRKEHKALVQEGDHRLKHTKYHWLRGGGPRKEAEQERFEQLRQQALRTARAWAIKDGRR